MNGLVLDAPMTDLEDTVYRQLGDRPLNLPAFYAGLVALSIELWSGFVGMLTRPWH